MLIDIVLSSFNGERFICEQLDSLVAQSFTNCRVLIGDDGSTDRTLFIISEYQKRYPSRIFLLETPGKLGACGNFAFLLSKSTADYVFFSDQDDVWDSDKIQVCMDEILSLEKKYGPNVPLLIYSDLRIVDENLCKISSSFFEKQHLQRFRTRFKDLLFQNVVTGCTVLVNRSLIQKALPFPREVVMHDWWLALIAAAFGEAHCVDRPMVSYRQHSENQIGAKGWSIRYVMDLLTRLSDRRLAANVGYPIIRQAKAFSTRFGHALGVADSELVDQLRQFDKYSGVHRLIKAFRMRVKKHGCLRTIAFYWLLVVADFTHRYE